MRFERMAKRYYKRCLAQYIQAERKRAEAVDPLIYVQNWAAVNVWNKRVDQLEERKREAYATYQWAFQNDCSCNGVTDFCEYCQTYGDLTQKLNIMEEEDE